MISTAPSSSSAASGAAKRRAIPASSAAGSMAPCGARRSTSWNRLSASLATDRPAYRPGPPRRRHSDSTQAANGMAPDALRLSSRTAATCRRRANSSAPSASWADGVSGASGAASNRLPCGPAPAAAGGAWGAMRSARSSRTGTGVTWSSPNRRCKDVSVRPQYGARSTDSQASRSPGWDRARTSCTRSATTGRKASGTRSTARQRMPSWASRRVRLPRWLRARTSTATGCLAPLWSISAWRTRPTAMSSACASAGAAPSRDQAGWKRTAGSGSASWKAVDGL
ncbi:hypothetical protein D9M72_237620 [compost metagenome]